MIKKAGSAARERLSAVQGPGASAVPAFVCPKCQGAMRTYVRGGIVVEMCEDCRGIYLDKGELERLIDVEGGGWSGILAGPDDPIA